MMALIQFHDTLHGFRTGRGTGNAFLEANLIQQLTNMMEEVLQKILLNLHESYHALDRNKLLNILVLYGVGPWVLHNLR